MTQLQKSILTILSTRVECLAAMNLQIANLLYDQFMTGAFDGIKLSGVDKKRKFFKQTITPEEIRDTCDYTVKIVPQLPQDDMSRWAMAKLALDARLLSRVDILDNIIGLHDSQQALDKVKAEMAEQGLPEAVLYDMMMAAADREDFPLAQLYLMEFQRLMAVKMGLFPPAPPDGGGKGQPGSPSQGGGQMPEVMPNAMTGAPPEPETSNNGPSFQAPGTPRPGAQGQQA